MENKEETKMNSQQRKLKSGEYKHVGCILDSLEQNQVNDLQQLMQILVPNNKIGMSGVLRFMLKTYFKDCKDELLREIRQTLMKDNKNDF